MIKKSIKRTIGYANIYSSVQVHRLKFNKVWTCTIGSDAQEKLKDYDRRSEERSTRSQHLGSEERMLLRTWRTSSDSEDHQTQKISIWLRRPPDS